MAPDQLGVPTHASCYFATNSYSSAITPKRNRGKTVIDRHDRNENDVKNEMSKIVRNAILARCCCLQPGRLGLYSADDRHFVHRLEQMG